MIASRADISAMGNAPVWLAAGFLILLIHVTVMVILAKLIRLDIFTCGVASLANIGGTATAPVLAGAYSNALVPIGILMASPRQYYWNAGRRICRILNEPDRVENNN